jgi:hypothetical protein
MSNERVWFITGCSTGFGYELAAAIIRAVQADQPPLRLLLGSDAYQLVLAKLDVMRQDFEAWRELTCSTDFPRA